MENRSIILFSFLIIWSIPFIYTKAQSDNRLNISSPENDKNTSSEISNIGLNSSPTISKFNPYADIYGLRPHSISHFDISRHVPTSLNYNISENYKLSENLYITPYNMQTTHIGLGYYKNIGALLQWKPSSRLSIEGGSFLSLQHGYVFSSRSVAYGYNWGINYSLTNRLLLNMHGQYMINNSKDPFLNFNNNFPKTGIGVSLNYNIKKNTNIGIGTEYLFDEHDRRWKTETRLKLSITF